MSRAVRHPAGALALASILLCLGNPARSEVWEFDRAGGVLARPAPREHVADNTSYDVEHSPPAISTRDAGGLASAFAGRATGRLAAIYRPMAEGVARTFAETPGVAAAGLDAEAFARLFVALIDQESRFDPSAVSPKGARGLGQLMPATAAALGVADAFEPLANLRGAARYLTAQLAAFGRVDLALAAYNAGPHRVTRYAGVPPFRETRDYVARITAAADLGPSDPAAPRTRAETERVVATRADVGADAGPEAATPFSTPQQGTVLEW